MTAQLLQSLYTTGSDDITKFYDSLKEKNNRSIDMPLTQVQTAKAAYIGTLQALKDYGITKA